jgi:predicted amidophosphoribosyltransferase
MYCPECKVNYKGEFKYCVTCNEELLAGKICSHCHTANSESSKICNLCGEFIETDVKKLYSAAQTSLDKTYKVCPSCSQTFASNKIYCETCGGNLELKNGIAAELSYGRKKSLLTGILSYLKVY